MARSRWLVSVGLALAAWSFAAAPNAFAATTCPNEPADRMGILLPFYVYPSTSAYSALAQYGSSCTVYAIVTGDSSGPPTQSISTYTSVFQTLKNSGAKLFGYIHSMSNVATHTARPLSELQAEINSWYANFGSLLLGIFVDEVDQNTANVNALQFYAAITDAIQEKGGRVLFNPGTFISCSLAYYSDVYVRYENNASSWAADRAGVTCECGNVSSCAVILHGQAAGATTAATDSTLSSYRSDAVARGMSYLYVTNRTMPNPWDGLPSYMDRLVAVAAPQTVKSPPSPPLRKSPPPSPSPPKPPPPSPSPPRPRSPPPSPSPPKPSPPKPPPPRPSPPSPPPPRPSPPNPSPKPSPSPSPKPRPSPSPSPSPKPSPSPSSSSSPSPSPSPSNSVWRPTGAVKWQWQLSGTDFKPMLQTRPEVIDIDIDMVGTMLAQANELGIARSSYKLICYFSFGSYEPFRVDADLASRNVSWSALETSLGGAAMPGPVYLKPLDGPFSDEKWLAIDKAATRTALIQRVMLPRLQHAKRLGCDGVEPDNVDTYDNVPVGDTATGGRGVTKAQQLAYNAALLHAAHDLGLSIGLKNALALLPLSMPAASGNGTVPVRDAYDWFLNEECHLYEECSEYTTQLASRMGSPAVVMGVEYCDAKEQLGAHNVKAECACALANAAGGGMAGGSGPTLSWLIKAVDLTHPGLDCREYCKQAGVTCAKPAAGASISTCFKDVPADICSTYGITSYN